MAVGADTLFCGRCTVFHCEQYICCDVQEYGYAQRNAFSLYQHALSSMGDKTIMEPIRGYHRK